MSGLLDAVGDAPFIFVAGKGGVGKTTTAGALSIELADSGILTHLISTDPAHSLADLFQHPVGGEVVTSPCSDQLHIEEFEADRAAAAWLERALVPVAEIVERGTYLDAADVTAFSRLALPGIDEMMAVLRLADLAGTSHDSGTRRVVVDTAPTGHTLRLLDAAATHASIARALRAMADKASAVAGALTGRGVRLRGEDVIDQLDRYVAVYRERVLGPAAFVVATRPGAVIEAETVRLTKALRQRQLHVVAILSMGGQPGDGPGRPRPGTGNGEAGRQRPAAPVLLRVPVLPTVSGCDGLRTWREHVGPGRSATAGPTAGPGPPIEPAGPGPLPIKDWLEQTAPRLLLFAGKGGVGKSTCAAAAALALARTRDVLLCSTDPAGSLDDVLGPAADRSAERLRVRQITPAAQLERLRDSYREDIVAALESLGLSQSANLDRRVIESLWDLAPPGLDELAATASILTASATHETIVIDSSPTGHFLRLLEMPDIALGWTKQLMRVFVKYGIAGVAGNAAESLIELSRELKALREALHDGRSAAVIVVTLDEPMVRAETERLVAALDAAHIRVAAVLINRSATAVGSREVASGWNGAGAVLRAAALDPSPVGERDLRRFVETWNIVT